MSFSKWVFFYATLPFAAWWLFRHNAWPGALELTRESILPAAAVAAAYAMLGSFASGVFSLTRRDAQFRFFSLLMLLFAALPALAVYFLLRVFGA